MRLALPRLRLRVLSAVVAHVPAAISLRVGVKNLLVPTVSVDSDAIRFSRNWSRVDHEGDAFTAPRFANEGNNRVIGVVEVDPLEAFVSVVLIVERRLVLIEPVEVLH